MRYFYLRDERRFPVACIASELRGSEVFFAISTYNPIDPYNKVTARRVASGRLAANKDVGKIPVEGGKIKARIVELLVNFPPPLVHAIDYPTHVPERAKRAARRWLAVYTQREKKTSNQGQEVRAEGNLSQQQKQA